MKAYLQVKYKMMILYFNENIFKTLDIVQLEVIHSSHYFDRMPLWISIYGRDDDQRSRAPGKNMDSTAKGQYLYHICVALDRKGKKKCHLYNLIH